MARSDVTVIVLAGGASTRMGEPKALLRFGSETLVERVCRKVSGLGRETIVVSAAHVGLPSLSTGVRLVQDEVSLQGPVAGLLFGFRAATTALCFVCACDLPFPDVGLARELISRARGANLVVPRWKGRRQHLFAVYRRRAVLPILERRFARGELRMYEVVDALDRVREVPEPEICRIDPAGLSFVDVDSPEDYERALKLAGER